MEWKNLPMRVGLPWTEVELDPESAPVKLRLRI
jgi:hypothetical protein